MVFQLIYASAVRSGTDISVLQSIALRAAQKNERSGITGLMVYYDGSVMQILEGGELEIRALFDVIKQDERHTNLLVLHERNIEERQFQNWRMGFKPLESIDAYHELFGISPKSFNDALPENPDKILATLARSFERSSGLAQAN